MCTCTTWSFGYFDNGHYKWHCRGCKTTRSGPHPSQQDVLESIVDLERREAEFRAAAEKYAGMLVFSEQMAKMADSLRKTADGVRALLREERAA